MPFLVTAIDLLWGWWLGTYAKPWLFALSAASEAETAKLFSTVLEPRLWIGYASVVVIQLLWVGVIAKQAWPQQRLSRIWWLGCGLIVSSLLALQHGLQLSPGAFRLLLAVQAGDLLLLYWLATRLMTPLPQRRVIPGWW